MNSYDKKKKRGRRRGRLIRIIDALMTVITIIAAVMLILAYLARYISPEQIWVFAFAGLIAPILYLVNIVMILYWGMRWSRLAFVPIIVVLIGLSGLSLFFRPSFSKDEKVVDSRATTIISYNVMGFRYTKEDGKLESSLEEISRFVKENNTDIFCIQEFECRAKSYKPTIDSIIGLPYNVVNYKLKNRSEGGWGVAIYSRFPIINSGALEYSNSSNSSIWADIVTTTDTVRVFNNHLQTTSVNQTERDYLSNHEYVTNDHSREERVRGIASKLKRNFIIRARQTDTLAPIIRESPYKVIVCGDFNDTPISYAYTKVGAGLVDTFAKKGGEVNAHTYKGLFNMFRIDYILHSKEMRTLSYDSPPIKYSDHKPVVVRLYLPSVN